jgi:hypothetical protein
MMSVKGEDKVLAPKKAGNEPPITALRQEQSQKNRRTLAFFFEERVAHPRHRFYL